MFLRRHGGAPPRLLVPHLSLWVMATFRNREWGQVYSYFRHRSCMAVISCTVGGSPPGDGVTPSWSMFSACCRSIPKADCCRSSSRMNVSWYSRRVTSSAFEAFSAELPGNLSCSWSIISEAFLTWWQMHTLWSSKVNKMKKRGLFQQMPHLMLKTLMHGRDDGVNSKSWEAKTWTILLTWKKRPLLLFWVSRFNLKIMLGQSGTS